MMRAIRVFRTNGDSLRCWFSPEGSLSSAVLLVEGKEFDVSGQLPGLIIKTAAKYLADLGYVREHDSECICIGQAVNKLLEGTDLFVETVLRGGGQTVLSIALREDREKVCCRRSLVAVYDESPRGPRLEGVRNSAHAEEFLARVKCASPGV